MSLDHSMLPESLVTQAGEFVAGLAIYLGIQAFAETGLASCCRILETCLAH